MGEKLHKKPEVQGKKELEQPVLEEKSAWSLFVCLLGFGYRVALAGLKLLV